MKTIRKYTTKTKAAFVLLMVMSIVLWSNFNSLQNSKKANHNINALHKDRLVVARYIFQYTNALHSIKASTLDTENKDFQKKEKIKNQIQTIQNLDKLYLKTVLTSKEKKYFKAFQLSCLAIAQESKNKEWSQIRNSSDQALASLELLSQIQIKEGESKLIQSNSLHNSNTIVGELQIALLVILGGFALFLLLVKKKKITIKIPEPPSMN